MKRLILLAMILAFIAGFGFVGCDYFDDDDETNQTEPGGECACLITHDQVEGLTYDIKLSFLGCEEIAGVTWRIDDWEWNDYAWPAGGSSWEFEYTFPRADVYNICVLPYGVTGLPLWDYPQCRGLRIGTQSGESDLMLFIGPRPGWGQDDILMTLVGFDATANYTILYGETSPPMIPKDTIIGWPAAGYGTESIYPTTYWQVRSSSGEVSNIVPYSWPE